MDKKEALEQCRYYKGKPDCPYEEGSLQQTAWSFERLWVNAVEKDSPVVERAIEEYKQSPLSGYRSDDGVNLSLRAFLANRFFYHWGREDVPEFKAFYEALYSNLT